MTAPTEGRPTPSSHAERGKSPPSELAIVELQWKPRGQEPWLASLARRPGLKLRLRSCRPLGRKQRLAQMLELSAKEEDAADAIRYVRSRPGVSHLALYRLSAGRWLVAFETPASRTCLAALKAGATCVECPSLVRGPEDEGTRRWTLMAPGIHRVRRLYELLGREAERPISIRVRRLARSRELTPLQVEIVRTAVRTGYYEFPRRTNLHALARMLGRSPASLSETLRRAEATILASSPEVA